MPDVSSENNQEAQKSRSLKPAIQAQPQLTITTTGLLERNDNNNNNNNR